MTKLVQKVATFFAVFSVIAVLHGIDGGHKGDFWLAIAACVFAAIAR